MKSINYKFLLVITLIGLVIASLFDLKISQLIFNDKSTLGLIGEAIGEVPGILIGVFGCAALILTYKRKSLYSKISSFLFGGIFLVLLSYMAAFLPVHYFHLPSWLTYITALIYLILVIIVMKNTPKDKYSLLRKLAWVAVLTFLTETIMINLIKFGWSRVRYRDLLESTEAFSAWFIPHGFTGNTEHTSFPSGHVANASVILFITLLPNIYTKLDKYKKILSYFCYVWIGLIMVSRIMMGAHFLSDTIVGMWVTVLILLIYVKVFKIEK